MFKASPGKYKTAQGPSQNRADKWLKYYSTCLESMKPSVQTSVLLKKKKERKKENEIFWVALKKSHLYELLHRSFTYSTLFIEIKEN
jgi:hypothetical protein